MALNYIKGFKEDTCIAYAFMPDMQNKLIAGAEITIYGGRVCELTSDPMGIEDEIYSALSKGRDSKAMEIAKSDYENCGNDVQITDLCFSESDNNTYAVWHKNAMFDNAYVLIADGNAEKPLEFYKTVPEKVKEYITSIIQR